MSLKEDIHKKSIEFFEEIREIRRHLHANPELSFVEFKTAEYIKTQLSKWNIPFKTIATTGIIAEIEGIHPESHTIALRSDHDALPIQEKNDCTYKSLNTGIMHACGHDVHTSSLLGAAKILSELKDAFTGSIRLIFQPGEEKLPGGASKIIEEGGLKNPVPKAIIGQHVTNEIQNGNVGFRAGIYMASTDEIYIKVIGKGGHAAMPHKLIDPIIISANLMLSLQQMISRRANPAMPTVLSFGKIIGNGATNVIPDEVNIEGTFRTFNEVWRTEAHSLMKSLANSLVEGMGAKVEFEIRKGYPFLKNEEKLTNYLIEKAKEYLGADHVEMLDIRTTAEDFAFYSQQVPACFYRLGTGNVDKGITAPVHSAQFDIDENALKTGMGLMAWLAIQRLNASNLV